MVRIKRFELYRKQYPKTKGMEFGSSQWEFELSGVRVTEVILCSPFEGFRGKTEPIGRFFDLKKGPRIFFDFKAHSHDPFLRIRFLLVPEIGSCEHIPTFSPQKRNLEIGPSERLLPTFGTKDRILKIGSSEL